MKRTGYVTQWLSVLGSIPGKKKSVHFQIWLFQHLTIREKVRSLPEKNSGQEKKESRHKLWLQVCVGCNAQCPGGSVTVPQAFTLSPPTIRVTCPCLTSPDYSSAQNPCIIPHCQFEKFPNFSHLQVGYICLRIYMYQLDLMGSQGPVIQKPRCIWTSEKKGTHRFLPSLVTAGCSHSGFSGIR